MPVTLRKRKAAPEPEKQTAPAKKPKKAAKPARATSKDGSNIVGGMAGDYRVTGSEVSSQFTSYTVTDEKGKDIPCQRWATSTESQSGTTLVFTHGAGGGIENPATKLFAAGYAREAEVVLFQGTMNLQSRVKSFEAVIAQAKDQDGDISFAAGGRSMGARAAVIAATKDNEIKKLVLVSYPLRSPSGDVRDKILLDLGKEKEVLFVIGSQDSMCALDELRSIQKKMKASSKLLVVNGADHGMSLGSGSGVSGKNKGRVIELVRQVTGQLAARWVADVSTITDGQKVDPVKVLEDDGNVD